MSAKVDLQSTMESLRRQAEAIGELQRRCGELGEAGERSPEQLEAATSAIDACIDGCLVIAEQAAAADPAGEWRSAVTELERQLRRLAVLRSQVLALYVAPAGARCGS